MLINKRISAGAMLATGMLSVATAGKTPPKTPKSTLPSDPALSWVDDYQMELAEYTNISDASQHTTVEVMNQLNTTCWAAYEAAVANLVAKNAKEVKQNGGVDTFYFGATFTCSTSSNASDVPTTFATLAQQQQAPVNVTIYLEEYNGFNTLFFEDVWGLLQTVNQWANAWGNSTSPVPGVKSMLLSRYVTKQYESVAIGNITVRPLVGD